MSVAVAVLLISIVMQTYRFPAALIFNMVAPLMCLLTTILIGWIYQDKERSRQKIVRMGQHLFLETSYALGSVEEDDEQFTEELGEDASADDGEQPAEEDQEEIEIVLPWQMIWRANRVGYFIATGMQLFGAGLVLLAMTASHFFNTDPAEMDQGWQFVMLFVFILLSFAAICAVAMAFLLYRRIDVSESDITTRHWDAHTRSAGKKRGCSDIALAPIILN